MRISRFLNQKINDFSCVVLNYIQSSSFMHAKLRTIFLRSCKFSIDSSARIASGCFIGARSLKLGKYAFVNKGAFFDGCAPIVVGDFVRIGPRVTIITGTHNLMNNVIRRNRLEPTVCRPVVIERGCWVGSNVTILPGVTIAEGCVIGAGAVLIKSTEKNGLYAGNPAKRLKDLPCED